MDDDTRFGEAASQQGASITAAIRVLRDLEGQITVGPFYLYRIEEGGGGAGGGTERKRTLLAFRTGDDALSFAQRNRLRPTPRLLRLTLAHILTIMLHRPNVEAVLFVATVDDDVRRGQFPDGQRVTRARLLASLAGEE